MIGKKKIDEISEFLGKSIVWNYQRFKIADITHGINIILELGADKKLKKVAAYCEKMVENLREMFKTL